MPLRQVSSPRPPTHEFLESDASFDELLPPWAQKVSKVHWTPMAVATRAAELLVRDRRSRILDVGSGVGKFCHIASMTREAWFVGVEQREELVAVARELGLRLGLPQTRFIVGDAFVLDWNEFDGVYFFNPFLENIADYADSIPGHVHRSSDRYVAEVEATCVKLNELQAGGRVATYHGFGGPMPKGFERIHAEPIGSDQLEIWEKRARR